MMKNKSLWTSLFNAGAAGDRSNWKFGWSPKSPLRTTEDGNPRHGARPAQERHIVAGYGLLIQRPRSHW
jgi:hypothetical protein